MYSQVARRQSREFPPSTAVFLKLLPNKVIRICDLRPLSTLARTPAEHAHRPSQNNQSESAYQSA
jgi:hypothetical protein